ncbi:hypothetical protein [Dactylosporangium sp. NPDC050588]|uniref:hypothetical protein n=1 Tax=Dactylosporangium sp. NPDC050588 TaxID=3157211 RepID=UPI0033FF3BBA
MITSPLVELFPALARHARTATRLHPTGGEVTMYDSHAGGPLLWPDAEPWPVCREKREVEERVPLPDDLVRRMRDPERREAAVRELGGGYTGWTDTADGRLVGTKTLWRRHEPHNPLLPVAQLRAADVKDLPRPKGTDMLQVLWCPAIHKGPPWGPVVRLRWRRQADVTEPLEAQPVSRVDHARYALRPCRFEPERVTEYPPRDELPVRLRQQVEAWGGGYDAMAVAPGWKAGGYSTAPVTGYTPAECSTCGGRMKLALVIATSEAGEGGNWQRPGRGDPDEPTGVLIGRYGSLRIFVCTRCPGTPSIEDIQ